MGYRRTPHDMTVFTANLAFVAQVNENPDLTPWQVAKDAEALRTIARAVTKIHVHQCNGYPVYDGRYRDHRDRSGYGNQAMADEAERRDSEREALYVAQAFAIAERYGVRAVFQGDPRGWCMRLLAHSDVDSGNSGLPVPE